MIKADISERKYKKQEGTYIYIYNYFFLPGDRVVVAVVVSTSKKKIRTISKRKTNN